MVAGVQFRGVTKSKLLPFFQAVVAFLPKDIDDYNNKPHTDLFGLTPHEVFHVAIPDRRRFGEKNCTGSEESPSAVIQNYLGSRS